MDDKEDMMDRYHKGMVARVVMGLMLCWACVFSVSAQTTKFDFNSADAATLTEIPGIGPAKASEIIAMREQLGGFKSDEQLLAVPGIGEKTLEKILQYGEVVDEESDLDGAFSE